MSTSRKRYRLGSNTTFGIANNGVDGRQKLAGASSLGPSNGWTHVAVVMTTSSIAMFVNGVQVASAGNNTNKLRPKDLGAIDYAWLGRSQFTSNPTFDGAIDGFRVYDRALTADEVQALYALR